MIDGVATRMTYDALIFDLDGVLLTGWQTSDTVYRRSTATMLEAYGYEDADWSSALENPDCSAAFREACANWEIPPDPAWGYRERAATQFETARIASGERATFDDADTLAELRKSYALGIVSNNRHCLVAWCVESLPWGSAISAYRGRYPTLPDYDRMKPDPTYLASTIEKMGVEDVLFVGDRRSDVLTADRVGCDSALLSRSNTVPPGNHEPTYHISSLTDLQTLHDTGWIEH